MVRGSTNIACVVVGAPEDTCGGQERAQTEIINETLTNINVSK